jgi:hypothetical protein
MAKGQAHVGRDPCSLILPYSQCTFLLLDGVQLVLLAHNPPHTHVHLAQVLVGRDEVLVGDELAQSCALDALGCLLVALPSMVRLE